MANERGKWSKVRGKFKSPTASTHPWMKDGAQVIPNFILKRLPAYFLAGRGIGLTPTCSSAVYGAP